MWVGGWGGVTHILSGATYVVTISRANQTDNVNEKFSHHLKNICLAEQEKNSTKGEVLFFALDDWVLVREVLPLLFK